MKNLMLGLMAVLSVAPVMAKSSPQVIRIEVTKAGFVPNSIDVAPGTDVTLEVTRKTDETCSKDIQVPAKNVGKTELPLEKPVLIALGKLDKGEIKFGCGMDMMDSGKIHVH